MALLTDAGRACVIALAVPAVAVVALPSATAAGPDTASLSLEQLMDIPVVAAAKYEQRQRDVAAAVGVITRDELRAFGWRTLGEALASLPGVWGTYDRTYTYLGFRGYGLPGDLNTRVLIAIDGQRVNDPTYDGAPAGHEFPLDLDLVERIEFIPGPGGAVYGQNAMFGVINVVTRRGADLGGTELRAGGQSRRRLVDGRASFGHRLDGGGDLVVSVSGLRARGESLAMEYPGAGPDGATVSGRADGMDGERDRELYARLATGPWTFALVYGDRRKDDPTGSYFTDPLVGGQYSRDSYAIASARYARQLRNGLDVLARVYVSRYRFEALSVYEGLAYPGGGRGDAFGGEVRLVGEPAAGHKLMVGVEAQRAWRTDQYFNDALDPALDIRLPGSGHRVGAYLQDEWQLAEAWTAVLGVRVDDERHTGTSVNPRLAAIWRPAAATTVKALYGRAGRAPNAYERAFDDGVSQVANPALGPERIDTLEAVVDHQPSPSLALRASAFRWTMRDVIVLGATPDGLTQYQATGRAQAKGVELSLLHAWAWGGRLRASATFQRAEDGEGQPLPNSPRRLARLLYAMPLPWDGVRLGAEVRYDGPRATVWGQRVGGATVANLHVAADAVAPGVGVAVTVANLTDKRYAHPGSDINWQDALPQDGRSVRVQVEWRF